MDLLGSSQRVRSIRLLRRRGDGPVQMTSPTPISMLLTPQARGWTNGMAEVHGHSWAYPAGARMDHKMDQVEHMSKRLPRKREDGYIRRTTT